MLLKTVSLSVCIAASLSMTVSCGNSQGSATKSVEACVDEAVAAYQARDTAAYVRALRDTYKVLVERTTRLRADAESGKMPPEEAMKETMAINAASMRLVVSTKDTEWLRRCETEQSELWKQAQAELDKSPK